MPSNFMGFGVRALKSYIGTSSTQLLGNPGFSRETDHPRSSAFKQRKSLLSDAQASIHIKLWIRYSFEDV